MTQNANDFYYGKVAFITGAASGIGLCLADLLHQRGCHVVMTDIDEIPKLAGDHPGEVWQKTLDVRDFDAFEKLFSDVIKHFGRIDLMFNNAGVAIGGPAYEYEHREWQHSVDVNVSGVTNGIYLAYKQMRSQRSGHIINTSSIVGRFPNVLTPMYSATKSLVTILTEQLRMEGAQFGVRFHALLPGAVDTPILMGGKHGRLPHGVSEEKMRRYWKRMSPASPKDIARQTLYAIEHNHGEIILPKRWRYISWLYRYINPLWRLYSKKALQQRRQKLPITEYRPPAETR